MMRQSVSVAPHGAFSVVEFGDPRADKVLMWLHATGFHAQTYRTLLAGVATALPDYAVVAVDQRGHGQTEVAAPVGFADWHGFVDDMQALLDSAVFAGRELVIAGHSMGGWTAMQLALLYPERVRGVYVCDPVVASPAQQRLAGWGHWVPGLRGLMARRVAPMVAAARRRRALFPSLDAMLHSYRNRGIFTGWSDAQLMDYLEGGTKPAPDGSGNVVLTCRPEYEAAVFGGSRFNKSWPRFYEIAQPMRMLLAEHGSTFPRRAGARLAQRQGAAVQVVAGEGHMFPITACDWVAEDMGGWVR